MSESKVHTLVTGEQSRVLRRVAVVGTGQVGMAIAYAMMIENTVDELLLVDVVPEKAEGEAMDLNHAMPFASPMNIRHGSLDDCLDLDLIIITAGAKRRPGDTRLDLLHRNAGIFKDMIPALVRHSPDAILLIVSNPVDVMTYIAWKLSGFAKHQVLGSGTILDTARLKSMVGERLHIDPRNVHAYVIGEHGDSEVAVWSQASVSGVGLSAFFQENGPAVMAQLAANVRTVAAEVIKRKGATSYAIGLGVARLAQAILRNQRRVMTVSCYVDGLYGLEQVCLSLPSVVGCCGVERVLEMELNEPEQEALRRSGAILREALASLGY